MVNPDEADRRSRKCPWRKGWTSEFSEIVRIRPDGDSGLMVIGFEFRKFPISVPVFSGFVFEVKANSAYADFDLS
jgi:hypothetical protein